jgi:predicted MFS family arabinose efflux permease
MVKTEDSSELIQNKLTKSELGLLFVLALVQFTHIIDFMIVMPLGAQFMTIFSITPKQFSWIVSSYSATAFVAGFLSALFIDRFDRKYALLLLYVGFILGTFACSQASSYVFFLLARMLTGAFGGVLAALILSIVGDVIPFSRRGRAMSVIMTAFSAASVIGVPLGLYLAAQFNWKMPFLATALFSSVVGVLIFFVVPTMKKHLQEKQHRENPFVVLAKIAQNSNQLQALLFNVVLMLGHFTIIPFIAPYMQLNIGFSDFQITYVYLIGGLLTVFVLPVFGRLSDKFGHARVFAFASLGAVFSIFAITNLPPVSIPLALLVTSSFFVVASGRNVPALTLITSVVRPENRGSFLSIRSSINEASLAFSTIIAGSIVTEGAGGTLQNYAQVGYIAMAMSLLAILLARRIQTIN